jgi:hypothetical protein
MVVYCKIKKLQKNTLKSSKVYITGKNFINIIYLLIKCMYGNTKAFKWFNRALEITTKQLPFEIQSFYISIRIQITTVLVMGMAWSWHRLCNNTEDTPQAVTDVLSTMKEQTTLTTVRASSLDTAIFITGSSTHELLYITYTGSFLDGSRGHANFVRPITRPTNTDYSTDTNAIRY